MLTFARALLIPLVLAVGGTACGGSTTTGVPSGVSDTTDASDTSDASADGSSPSNDGNTTGRPNAYVDSSLSASADLGADACGVTDATWLQVGATNAPADDGSTEGAFAVSVTCSVSANSDGSFSVNALVTDGSSGSVGVIGRMTSSGTQSGIHGAFTRGDTGNFSSLDCTVDFTMEPGMGIAAGRVWGYIECPDVVDASETELAPDGAAVSRTCAAGAIFKFQNCSE